MVQSIRIDIMDGFLILKSLLQYETSIHKIPGSLPGETLMYEIWKTAMVVKTYAVADGRNVHTVYEKNP